MRRMENERREADGTIFAHAHIFLIMNKLIVAGDRVLITPEKDETHTETGLVLAAPVAEHQNIQMGKV